jgi:hypothetical protein
MGGGGKGTSSQQSTTQSSFQPPPWLLEAGQQAVQSGEALQQQPFSIPVQPTAGLSPQQTQAFQEVQNMQGETQAPMEAGMALNAAGASPNIGQYFGAESQGVLGEIQNLDAQQMAAATGSAAAQAGGLGADRIAVAQSELANQQNLAAGSTLSGIMGQAVGQAQTGAGLEQSAGSNIANIGNLEQTAGLQGAQAELAAGSLQQSQQQNVLNSQYQNTLQQIGWPYQTTAYLGELASGMAPTMGGVGTSTGYSTMTSSPLTQMGQIAGLGKGALSGIGGLGMKASGGRTPTEEEMEEYAAGGSAFGYPGQEPGLPFAPGNASNPTQVMSGIGSGDPNPGLPAPNPPNVRAGYGFGGPVSLRQMASGGGAPQHFQKGGGSFEPAEEVQPAPPYTGPLGPNFDVAPATLADADVVATPGDVGPGGLPVQDIGLGGSSALGPESQPLGAPTVGSTTVPNTGNFFASNPVVFPSGSAGGQPNFVSGQVPFGTSAPGEGNMSPAIGALQGPSGPSLAQSGAPVGGLVEQAGGGHGPVAGHQAGGPVQGGPMNRPYREYRPPAPLPNAAPRPPYVPPPEYQPRPEDQPTPPLPSQDPSIPRAQGGNVNPFGAPDQNSIMVQQGGSGIDHRAELQRLTAERSRLMSAHPSRQPFQTGGTPLAPSDPFGQPVGQPDNPGGALAGQSGIPNVIQGSPTQPGGSGNIISAPKMQGRPNPTQQWAQNANAQASKMQPQQGGQAQPPKPPKLPVQNQQGQQDQNVAGGTAIDPSTGQPIPFDNDSDSDANVAGPDMGGDGAGAKGSKAGGRIGTLEELVAELEGHQTSAQDESDQSDLPHAQDGGDPSGDFDPAMGQPMTAGAPPPPDQPFNAAGTPGQAGTQSGAGVTPWSSPQASSMPGIPTSSEALSSIGTALTGTPERNAERQAAAQALPLTTPPAVTGSNPTLTGLPSLQSSNPFQQSVNQDVMGQAGYGFESQFYNQGAPGQAGKPGTPSGPTAAPPMQQLDQLTSGSQGAPAQAGPVPSSGTIGNQSPLQNKPMGSGPGTFSGAPPPPAATQGRDIAGPGVEPVRAALQQRHLNTWPSDFKGNMAQLDQLRQQQPHLFSNPVDNGRYRVSYVDWNGMRNSNPQLFSGPQGAGAPRAPQIAGSLGPGSGMVSMDAAKHAIAVNESGGNYREQGPVIQHGSYAGDRAYGKYQVMGSDLSDRLRRAGLPNMTPQQFLNNPQAQEREFEVEFGGLMNKYGNFNDAASVWFSGRPLKQAGNASDGYMTTPAYVTKANRSLAAFGQNGQNRVAMKGVPTGQPAPRPPANIPAPQRPTTPTTPAAPQAAAPTGPGTPKQQGYDPNMKVSDAVARYAPEKASLVPSFIGNMTLGEAAKRYPGQFAQFTQQ